MHSIFNYNPKNNNIGLIYITSKMNDNNEVWLVE